MADRVYCVDTSAFLDGYSRYYPPEIFPGLWGRMDALAATGRIIAPQDVLLELAKRSDSTHGWAKNHQQMFVEVDGFQEVKVREILRGYPKLVGVGGGRNQADPWVIALAHVHSAMVVTGERGGTSASPKIPFICAQLGIECISFIDMVRMEGWTF